MTVARMRPANLRRQAARRLDEVLRPERLVFRLHACDLPHEDGELLVRIVLAHGTESMTNVGERLGGRLDWRLGQHG